MLHKLPWFVRAILAALVIFGVYYFEKLEDQEAANLYDQELDASKHLRREAREWAKQPNDKMVGNKLANQAAAAFIEKLYAAGAARAEVECHEEDSMCESATSLVATMPQDPTARKQLLEFYNRELKQNERDTGHRYLVFLWD